MNRFRFKSRASGQAMVEYALIVVLVVIAFAVALAATGPAIGNVFSNAVFNLLGLTSTPRTLPDVAAFWATVTWAAQQTPAETPFPTNPSLPPSATPTAGPSPTSTPITPSPTPTNTQTPTLTPTQTDLQWVAPWFDRVDNPEWWRIDPALYVGDSAWVITYYPNTNMSGTPTAPPAGFDNTIRQLSWANADVPLLPSWPSANPGQYYSLRMTRTITLAAATDITFRTTSDDGVRLWLFSGTPPASCNGVSTTGTYPSTGSNTVNSSGCLLIDNWRNQGANTLSVTRSLAAGTYTLRLDYYGAGTPNQISFAATGGVTNVNDSGACNWGTRQGSQSNTTLFMWDNWLGQTSATSYPASRTCTLELRGRVTIPATVTSPQLQFWSIWDLDGGNQVYVEVSEYIDPALPAYSSPTRVWTRYTPAVIGTANYNWTQFMFNLPASYINKDVTIRFVMVGAASGNRRWYIDDVSIVNANNSTVYTIGRFWNLNASTQSSDFITSGRWGLSTKNARPDGGMSWDDSPGGPNPPGASDNVLYDNFNGESRNYGAGTPYSGYRVHALELNGWVNLSGAAPDLEGDTGDPLLSFYVGYDLGANAWIEVQYTRTPYGATTPPAWTTVGAYSPPSTIADPACNTTGGSGNPQDGCIVRYNTTTRTATSLAFREVNLAGVPGYNSGINDLTQGQFRLRIVLIVPQNATRRDGVWIDDLYIERTSRPRFLQYPFFDDAEVSDGNWRFSGTFARFAMPGQGMFGSNYVYTDTAVGNYFTNSNYTMTARYGWDLNNDTPANPASPACNLGPGQCTGGGVAAIRPVLSFYHWRMLAPGASITVDWKRSRDPDTAWAAVWRYDDSATTVNGNGPSGAVTNSRTRDQVGWERVQIDMLPILNAVQNTSDPTDKTDDDIVFRIRLATGSSSVDDGIYIDNIRIEEYTELAFRLWDTGFDPDGAGPLPTGNGLSYTDGVDTPSAWWDRWYTGGQWTAVSYTTPPYGGLLSFHDSPGTAASPQTIAPYYNNGGDTNNGVNYIRDGFAVLEMRTIIDLRGVDTSRAPTLEFWHRYWMGTGGSDRLIVQVAVEDTTNVSPTFTATSPCGTAVQLLQCYERTTNWGRWQDLTQFTGDWRIYAWKRELINLSNFAGRRIRIRFVVDSLDSGTPRDGWYIDRIRFFHNLPTPVFTIPFVDTARNLNNWIPEGDWGLDVERFRGSGGAVADLGPNPWRAYWIECSGGCGSSSVHSLWASIPDTDTANTDAVATRQPGWGGTPAPAIPSPISGARAYPRFPPQFLADINFDFGSSGPRYSDGQRWRSDNFTARFTRDIVVAGGEYTFITISDDGVRLKYTPGPATAGAPNINGGQAGACTGWNIICRWDGHGRTVDMATVNLSAGNYRLVMEYWEGGGDAVIIATIGNNNFSFADTPKTVVSAPGTNDPMSIAYSDTSLTLDGVIDLCGVQDPVFSFATLYDLWNNVTLDVSTNGGFTWQNTASYGHNNYLGFSAAWSGYRMPPTDWQVRSYYLGRYRGQYVTLRFRYVNSSNGRPNGLFLTDINLNAAAITAVRSGGVCPNPTNYILVPGFEFGGQRVIWSLQNSAAMTNTPAQVNTGGWGVRLPNNNSRVFQVVSVRPSTQYTLRGWAQVLGAGDVVTIAARIGTNPTSGTVLGSTTVNSLTFTQSSAVTFTTNASTTQIVVYCQFNNGPGDGYCDDLSLTSP